MIAEPMGPPSSPSPTDVSIYAQDLEKTAQAAEAAQDKPAGGLSAEAKERNRRALAARKAKNQGFLPDGWRKVGAD